MKHRLCVAWGYSINFDLGVFYKLASKGASKKIAQHFRKLI